MSSRGPEGEQHILVGLLKFIKENPWNVPTFTKPEGWQHPIMTTDSETSSRDPRRPRHPEEPGISGETLGIRFKPRKR